MTATPYPNNLPNSALPVPSLMLTDPAEAAETTISLPPNHKCFSSFVDNEKLAVLSKGMTPANRGEMQEIKDTLLIRFQMTYWHVMIQQFWVYIFPGMPWKLESLMVSRTHIKPFTSFCVAYCVTWGISIQDAQIFLDKKDSRFKKFHGTLDSHYHNLHASGLGREVKHTLVLSKDDKMWCSGYFITTSFTKCGVLHCWKVFSLHGGAEMWSLGISQIKQFQDPSTQKMCLRPIVALSRSYMFQPRWFLYLFALISMLANDVLYTSWIYLSKLPNEAAFEQDVFYLCPLENIPSDQAKPWYSSVPVGKNTLERKLAVICDHAGIQGTITNYSLQATSATHMCRSGVPERSYKSELVTNLLKLSEFTDNLIVNNIKLYPTFYHQLYKGTV